MNLASCFSDETIYTATYESFTQTVSEGVLGDKVWSTDGTAPCLYWIGSGTKNNVADKFREEIDAVMLHTYNELTFSINESGRVTVNGEVFSILYVDNIANQNEFVQVLLKRYE